MGRPCAGVIRPKRTALGVTVFIGFVLPTTGFSQPVEESIALHTGWNAIWLNIEPEPNDLIDLLAQQASALDCQAIWTFEPNRDAAPAEANAAPGRWFYYDKAAPPFLHTLRTLQGQRAYFIKVNVGGVLQLTGRPVIRANSFTGRVSNLFGTMTRPKGGTLTFEKFFAHPNAAGKIVSGGVPVKHDIFALAGGNLVRRRLTDPIERNAAYWVNAVQDFRFAGPLDVTSSANGLSFGRSTAFRTLSVEIPSSPVSRTLFLQARPCVALDNSTCPGTAFGVDWLEYRDPFSPDIPVFRPLAEGLSLLVPPRTTTINVELRARRAVVAAVARGGDGSATLPPLVVDVTDDQGSRVVIPSDVAVVPIFGLWAGKAVLTHVSAHPGIQDIPLEAAEANPIEMTLILDLPSPSDTGGVSAPKLLDTVTIQTFRDGRSLQRRFSSVLFDRPVNLVADAGDPIDPLGSAGTLRGTLHILPEDPLNPYRHRYNPEHRKGYRIAREITIKLETSAPSLADELTGLDGTFGPHRLDGIYTEVITGISQQPITVQGEFRLERISVGIVGASRTFGDIGTSALDEATMKVRP